MGREEWSMRMDTCVSVPVCVPVSVFSVDHANRLSVGGYVVMAHGPTRSFVCHGPCICVLHSCTHSG